MKKLLLFIFTITLLCFAVKAQNYQPFRQYELLEYHGYQFTIIPGTEAWKSLDINENKHTLLQIPEDTLSIISTQRLIETCLYYPMMIDVFAFDNLMQGFDAIRKNFNGFNELFQRQDVTIHLLSYYQSRPPAFITQFEESVDKGRYSLDFVRLELMIAQTEVIKQLNLLQMQELVISILEKKQQQADLQQYYSRVFIPVSAIVVGKILLQANALPEATLSSSLSKFIEKGFLESPDDISLIFQQAQIFIDKNK
jgi:hypothetical protein